MERWRIDAPGFSVGNLSWLLDNGWKTVLNRLNRNNDKTVPDKVVVDERGDGVGPGVAINQWSSVCVKSVSAGAVTLLQADNPGQNIYGVVVTSAAVPATRPTFSAPRVSGTSLTLSWTGGGKLQEASDVTGPWTDVTGNPQNSFTATATGPRRFYRVVML